MIIRMAKVEILGPKEDLLSVLELLRGRGVFQPDPQLLAGVDLPRQERPRAVILDEKALVERRFFEHLSDRVRRLVGLLPEVPVPRSPLQPLPVMDVLDELVDQHLEVAARHRERLAEYQETGERLRHDLLFWQALEPLRAELPDNSGLELFGVTIRDEQQLTALDELLQVRTSGRCHVSTTQMADGSLIGLIATDRRMADELRETLDEQRVPELTLPDEFAGLSLSDKVSALRARLAAVDEQCEAEAQALADLARQWLAIYRQAAAWLEERLALYQATAAAYETRQCFVIQGWMAAAEVDTVREMLNQACAGRVVLEQQAILEDDLDKVPVALRNPGYFAPFELFSKLLPLPRYSSYDPTPLIGLFLPLLFGMILGDLGYGLVLLLLALFLVWRFPLHHLASDLGKVLGVAAVYSLLFGLLYGELFGDLGEHWLGLQPLWVDRGKAVLPMIAFAVTVGVAHVLLGLLLGLIAELRRGQRREACFKLALLLAVLLLVLTLVSWLQPQPWLATRPLLIAVGLLMPVLIAAGGLLAPLELLKTLGNVISYVRIMAIGLSSVLLAMVANRLGGMTGDLLLGILVAGLLHAFNLVLGLFAPTVHSLRLHYVEFFSKFLELGGRRFDPWHKRPS